MIILLISCKTLDGNVVLEKLSTYKDGYYTRKVYKVEDRSLGDNVWFSIENKDHLGNDLELPAWLNSGCPPGRALTKGKLSFKTKPAGVLPAQYEMVAYRL